MSKLTEVLKLLCYDPETDGNLTFNVTEALTKNWEKIDAALAPLGGATTPQAVLAALGAGGRKNELDNPGLEINQFGQESYDTSDIGKYTLDRWWSIFSIYDVNTRTLTSKNQTYGAEFRQAINNPSRFSGKKVTFTARIAGGTGFLYLFKGSGINSEQVYIATKEINGPGVYSVTADIPNDVGGSNYPYLVFAISGLVGQSIQFASGIPFKLEFGEGQTLAYQDSDGAWRLLPQPESDYATQLAKCQRYLYALESVTMCPGGVEDDNLIFGIRFPVEMRIAPVFIGAEGGNNLQLYVEGSSGFYENQNFTLQWSSRTGATIKCQSPISLPPNSACNGRIDGKLMFSAEL